ncbi:HupE/UreJ family protein [Allopontixanthobacter confluentis]|nr:HupE/UreJ family protein [Allopontixanthobacter confluentis]
MKWLIALLAGIVFMPGAAWGDELRPGYLELTQHSAQEWRIAWKLPLSAPPAGQLARPRLPANCQYKPPVVQGFTGGGVTGNAIARCTGAISGGTVSMPALTGPGDMLVRVSPLDEPVQMHRLTAREPAAQISARPATWQVLRSYFVLGVQHIMAGWDHLLFVIALVLLVRSGRAVVAAATAFTIAHSITLAGAALGFISMPQRPVEAMIALSIIFLALETLRSRHEMPTMTLRYPWVVAFLFGLLHGFGFAGALARIGLPQGDVLPALLAFNIGVEAGQLLVIFAVLTMIAILRRWARTALQPSIRISAYAVGITGSYWLIDRVLG